MTPPPRSGSDGGRRFFTRPPLWVLAVSLAAAALHMLPWWHAARATPAGWAFTGNVTVSPDAMQYRVWMRQALAQGWIVDDRFTAEVSGRFLPVSYYWAVAHLGRWLSIPPEWANAWIGVPLACAFVLLVWWTVRWFLDLQAGSNGRLRAWVFLAILFGGGLTAHLKLAGKVGVLREAPLLGRLIEAAHDSANSPTFEESRFHYVVRTLFDSHFLLIWLWTLAGLLCFYAALRRPSALRTIACALVFGGLTLLHIYEGATVLLVCGTVTVLCWRKRIAVRAAVVTTAASVLAVGACFALLLALQGRSGLPFPTWAAPSFPFSNVALAFPLAWVLIALGLSELWQRAGLDECFLLGWIGACTAMLLSHPYYPYHDRGAVTAQVVLYVLAGIVYARHFGRPGWRSGAAALALLAAAPLYVVHGWWRATDFGASKPWSFLSDDDARVVEVLAREGRPDDLLLAFDRDYRWLCIDYPGKSFDAHFFLTVDFERKREAVRAFFRAEPDEQTRFLAQEGVDWLYVNRDQDPERFVGVPGLRTVHAGERGTLFASTHAGRSDAK